MREFMRTCVGVGVDNADDVAEVEDAIVLAPVTELLGVEEVIVLLAALPSDTPTQI